jgi:ATP-dependent HslUV protease, peptidase subunit HslV
MRALTTGSRLLLSRGGGWFQQQVAGALASPTTTTPSSLLPPAFSSASFSSSSSSSSSSSNEMHGTTVLSVRHRGSVVIVADGQISMGSKVVKPNARKLRRLLPVPPSSASSSSSSSASSAATLLDADEAAALPGGGLVIGGFAGSTADGLTLFERLEQRLREHPGQLRRAAVSLAKLWRQDRVLRRLKAAMLVADATGACLEISGNGDVLEPADGVHAIGSGSRYALAAARALVRLDADRRRGGSDGGGGGGGGGASGEGGEGGGGGAGGAPGSFSALDIATRAMRVASERCVYTNDVWTWEGIEEATGRSFSGGSGGGGGEGAGGGGGH